MTVGELDAWERRGEEQGTGEEEEMRGAGLEKGESSGKKQGRFEED